MKLDDYRELKRRRAEEAPRTRDLCITCFQPAFGCYCEHVKPFDAKMRFVILIHPIEAKRRIATGRMSHLCLQRSLLIRGENYSGNVEIDRLVSDPRHHPVVLYPGVNSTDVGAQTPAKRAELIPPGKELLVFVIDGTWNTARKMVRSTNLAHLPRICFSPERPSNFRVRKQPAEGCFSTIEAIHQTIELLGDAAGFDLASRRHDNLLSVFDSMVEKQIECIRTLHASRQAEHKLARQGKRPA